MFNVLEVEPMRNRTLKTNDTNWRKLKNGEIKAEQIEINALQISLEEYQRGDNVENKD